MRRGVGNRSVERVVQFGRFGRQQAHRSGADEDVVVADALDVVEPVVPACAFQLTQVQGETAPEIGEVPLFRSAPCRLGHGQQPREEPLARRVGRRDILGPHVGLNAEQALLPCPQGFRKGFPAVNLAERVAVEFAVEVEKFRRRLNDAVSVLERRGQGGGHPAAPPHHRALRGQPVFGDLVPAEQRFAVCRQKLLRFTGEPCLQFACAFQLLGPDAPLAVRARLPRRALHFVASDMYVLRRKEIEQLCQHVFAEGDRAVAADAERCRKVFAPPAAAVARQLRITADGRQRVPRQVDFGNDLDAALCRVSDYLADVVLRVVTSVADFALFAAYVFLREEEFRVALVGRAPQADTVVFVRSAPCPAPGQERVAFDFDPPPLVVGQVQVQAVELVAGQPVRQRHDLLLGEEVARDVEHEAAPCEARGVVDFECRQRSLSAPQELAQ